MGSLGRLAGASGRGWLLLAAGTSFSVACGGAVESDPDVSGGSLGAGGSPTRTTGGGGSGAGAVGGLASDGGLPGFGGRMGASGGAWNGSGASAPTSGGGFTSGGSKSAGGGSFSGGTGSGGKSNGGTGGGGKGSGGASSGGQGGTSSGGKGGTGSGGFDVAGAGGWDGEGGAPDPGAPCGNSILDPGEGCEDRNQRSGDGCSSSCQPEPGYRCMVGVVGPCSPVPGNVSCLSNSCRIGSACVAATSHVACDCPTSPLPVCDSTLFRSLPLLPNGTGCAPIQLSHDASTVVGSCSVSGDGSFAVAWRTAGALSVEKVGFDPYDGAAHAVSGDGNRIAGQPRNREASPSFIYDFNASPRATALTAASHER